MIDPEKIKEYIKDKPELNILYDNMDQFSEDLMDTIIPMVYDEAKILAPSIARDPNKIPDIVILHGVIGRLLESESFLELRNQLQYQDNNMQGVPLSSKQGQYTQLSQIMKQYFTQMLSAMATASFYQDGWGASWSNSTDMDFIGFGYFGYDPYSMLV